jgi:RHS repeat-associated protein
VDENGNLCTYGDPTAGYWRADSGHVFAYDAVGNRLDQGGSYAVGNRIRQLAGCTFATDSLGDGNVLSRTCGTQTVRFHWSAESRLKAMQVVAGDSVDFRYDASGRLVRKDVNGAAQAYFLWQGDNLLAELTANATGKVAEYSYYLGLDNLHALIVGTTPYFAHVDGIQNVRALTDSATKTVQRSYEFDDWGALTGGTDIKPFSNADRARFKGALWLGPEVDVYYMRARWYEPKTGRFLSEDPFGLAGGINPYSFAGNDPINGRDPTGTCKEDEDQWIAFYDNDRSGDYSAGDTIVAAWCEKKRSGGGSSGNEGQAQEQQPDRCPAGPTAWPAGHEWRVTSPFGANTPGRRAILGARVPHRAIDQAMPIGTGLGPMAPGVVTRAESTAANGNFVKVRHDAVYSSWYLHGSKVLVQVGDRVDPWSIIMLSGESGIAEGPSLHFQLDSAGVPVDPARCLPQP